jgi:hypothetical protein
MLIEERSPNIIPHFLHKIVIDEPLPTMPTAIELNALEGSVKIIAYQGKARIEVMLLDAMMKFGTEYDSIVYNAITGGKLVKVVAVLRGAISEHDIKEIFFGS